MFKAIHNVFVVLLAMLLSAFTVVLGILPVIAIKHMMATFHASGSEMGFFTSVFYYPIFAVSLFSGPLIDKLNTRYIATASSLISTIGIYYLSISSTLDNAVIAAVVYGIGCSTTLAIMYYVIKARLSPKHFTTCTGIGISIGFIVGILCSIIFSYLLKTISWQAIALGITWVGAALTILIAIFVSNKRILTTTTTQNSASFLDTLRILLNNSEFWKIIILIIIFFIPSAILWQSWGIAFFMDGQGFTPQQSSIIYACLLGGTTVGLILFGFLSDYLAHRKLLLVTSLAASTILSLLLIYVTSLGVSWDIIITFLLGITSGSYVIIYYYATNVGPSETIGTAISLANTATYVGNICFILVVGKILDIYWLGEIHNNAPVFTPHGFSVAFCWVPLGFFFATILACSLKPLDSA
jgi:MFS family permease